jgi:hypothetical protein
MINSNLLTYKEFGLIAYYDFFNGTRTSLVEDGLPFQLKNTKFVNNCLYLNGIYYDDGDFASVCLPSRFEYDNFTICIGFNPLIKDGEQKWSGNIITVGFSLRWLSLRYLNNQIELTFNNQDDVFIFHELGEIKDNVFHTIVISFDLIEKVAVVMLNENIFEKNLPDDFMFSDFDFITHDRDLSFTNYSNGSTTPNLKLTG